MASFDVVSTVDIQEVRNAVEQVKKELRTRFDLKGSNCKIDLDEKLSIIVAVGEDPMKMQAVSQILAERLGKRDLSIKAFDFQEPKPAGGDTLRQEIKVKQCLTSEELKKINKYIKIFSMNL